jgi:dihydroorotate dehydrogenase electron transfer subunit
MAQHLVSKPQPITIKQIIQENYRTKTFVTGFKMRAKPGQFVMIWYPAVAERPFSITTTDPFSFTVSDVGPFSHFLNTKIVEGGKVWYRGPFGDGHYKISKGKKVLIVGGCGCVPLFHLTIKIQKEEGLQDTLVIIGARNKKELLFVDKFKQLGVSVKVATDDGSTGFKGFGLQLLEKLIEKKQVNLEKVACIYSCGPAPMLKKVAQFAQEHQLSVQLSLEEIMKCGFGVCGACAREGKLICKEGPVFNQWLE